MEWKLYFKISVAVLLILTASYIFLFEKSWSPKRHVDEPPLVPQRVPYIGHVAGLFFHGMTYFDSTRYVQAIASRRVTDKPK